MRRRILVTVTLQRERERREREREREYKSRTFSAEVSNYFDKKSSIYRICVRMHVSRPEFIGKPLISVNSFIHRLCFD